MSQAPEPKPVAAVPDTSTLAVDPLFLCVAPIATFAQDQALTNATGFFFERDGRLFLVTSRHVVADAPTNHYPDRLEIEVHVDAANLARSVVFSVPLYDQGVPLWRQGSDSTSAIDVAALELDQRRLPQDRVLSAFTPDNLPVHYDGVMAGERLVVVGFPLGFQDALHHLPVLRQALMASSYGLRFGGQGYFLTDGRMHRGSSGAPVVMRDEHAAQSGAPLPWRLLGVHSARLDMASRDLALDESLGLNCAWYADIVLTLTQDVDAAPEAPPPG